MKSKYGLFCLIRHCTKSKFCANRSRISIRQDILYKFIILKYFYNIYSFFIFFISTYLLFSDKQSYFIQNIDYIYSYLIKKLLYFEALICSLLLLCLYKNEKITDFSMIFPLTDTFHLLLKKSKIQFTCQYNCSKIKI